MSNDRRLPASTRTTRSRLLLGVLVALALVASTSSCQWAPNTRYVYPVFSQVDVTSNVAYRTTTTYTGASITLYLDIYRPHGDTATDRPVVMWMHGGSWINGNKSNMSGYATDSAKRGYVGVSIQYRLRPNWNDLNGSMYDAYDDSIAAAEWLKANAAAYGIDPDFVIAGGYSAGAINAMNMVFVPGTRGPATSPVAGAVAIAGTSAVPPTGARPPVVMFHGTADTTVPYSSGQYACNATINAGNRCQFVSFDGAGHEIGSTQTAPIREQSAHWMWEEVLWISGRQPETVG